MTVAISVTRHSLERFFQALMVVMKLTVLRARYSFLCVMEELTMSVSILEPLSIRHLCHPGRQQCSFLILVLAVAQPLELPG